MEGNGWKSKQRITHTRTISGHRPWYGLPEQAVKQAYACFFVTGRERCV